MSHGSSSGINQFSSAVWQQPWLFVCSGVSKNIYSRHSVTSYTFFTIATVGPTHLSFPFGKIAALVLKTNLLNAGQMKAITQAAFSSFFVV